MIRNFTAFLFGLVIGALLFLAMLPAHADDEDAPESKVVPIPNLSPAGPEAFEHGQSPLMYFGVKSCGQYVIYLVFTDDIRRIDKEHSPKDLTGFLKDLEMSKIPGDIAIIPCTAAAL